MKNKTLLKNTVLCALGLVFAMAASDQTIGSIVPPSLSGQSAAGQSCAQKTNPDSAICRMGISGGF